MRVIIKAVILIIIYFVSLYSQSLPDSTTRYFINSLLVRRDKLDKFVLPEELELSNRLGVTYKDVDKKYLISNDFDLKTRNEIIKNKFTFTYETDGLDEDYSLLRVIIPKLNLIKEYIFKDSFLISKPFYYSRNWKVNSSRYFVFHISVQNSFNNYGAEKLDNFVTRITHLLNFSDEQIEKLKQNKIHYFLCKDDNEIKQLTGYSARGLFYIPYDYIITTYNCHYHELLHLLINYKLQNLNLYTLPFLQEGFAVAYGGRGGKEPRVIHDMGLFLAKSGMADYTSLLIKPDFYQSDISMSYPVSGLYNKFLINKIGIDKYIVLYKKYSTTEDKIDNMPFDITDLPPNDQWLSFINSYNDSSVSLNIDNINNFNLINEKENQYKISSNNKCYLFQMKDTLLFSTEMILNYKSNLFSEIFPTHNYDSEKYAVIADSNEISVYNFYSNNLAAKYVRGFTLEQKAVPTKNGFYNFLLSKKLFDQPIGKLKIQ
jgi:hypothetical protein